MMNLNTNTKRGSNNLFLEDKVDMHETLEDKDAIQEIGKDEYHEEFTNII